MNRSSTVGALIAGLLPALLFSFVVTRGITPNMVVPVDTDEQVLQSLEPRFSGAEAYGTLSELVSAHARRYPQTPAMRAAADWARDHFASLGIDAEVEEYRGPVFYRSAGEIGPSMALKSIKELTAPHPGWNVVARLPGATEDLILVGAHLDIAYETVEGAKDDGSGVASVLELARVLASAPRRASYLFVLFDGEEIALRGSIAFVAAHPELRIRHVVIIDSVAQRGDDTLYAAHVVSHRGAGSSAALGLLGASARAEGLGFGVALTGVRASLLAAKLVQDRAAGIAYMDTGAFHGRAESVVGVATGGNQRSMGHSRDDIIGSIDPSLLEKSGRAVERYLAALDAGLLPALGQTLYVPAELPSGGVGILRDRAAWLVFAAASSTVLLALGIAVIRARSGFRGLVPFLRAELPFIIILAGVPIALSGALALVWFLPIAVYLGICILWFPCAFVLLPLLRRRRREGMHDSALAAQKLLHCALVLAVGIAWLTARGPFAAILASLPVVFAGLSTGFRTAAGRVASRVVMIAAGLYSLLLGIVVAGMGFFHAGLAAFAPLMALALFTATVGVYGFSFPIVRARAQRPVSARGQGRTPHRAAHSL